MKAHKGDEAVVEVSVSYGLVETLADKGKRSEKVHAVLLLRLSEYLVDHITIKLLHHVDHLKDNVVRTRRRAGVLGPRGGK